VTRLKVKYRCHSHCASRSMCWRGHTATFTHDLGTWWWQVSSFTTLLLSP